MATFNPKRLAFARKRRRYTKKSLADASGLSNVTLTRIETGENIPEADTIRKLSNILDFPVQFFFGGDIKSIDAGGVSFRSLSTLTSKDKDAALAAGDLGMMLSEWIAERFNLPEPDVPDMTADYTPEGASLALREYWGLGQRPIVDIIKLLESKGIMIFSLKEDAKTVDAFSFWRSNKPYIFLNSFKTVERSRFDAAHELGHLVMHRNGRLESGKTIEKDADLFASCFLMPEGDVRSNVLKNNTLNDLLMKKTRWKVSLASLCNRLHKLGIISDWQYRNYCIEINLRYKNTEPNSVDTIYSTLWEMIFRELWNKKITKATISKELNIPASEIEKLVVFREKNHADIMKNNTLIAIK